MSLTLWDEAGGEPGHMIRLKLLEENRSGKHNHGYLPSTAGGAVLETCFKEADGDACISEGVFGVDKWETFVFMVMMMTMMTL